MRLERAPAGILIRSAEALETAHKLDTIVLDKTGTVSVAGKPALTDVHLNGFRETTLLALVAAAEQDSEHPWGPQSSTLPTNAVSACRR